jgi:hypothetical protein
MAEARQPDGQRKLHFLVLFEGYSDNYYVWRPATGPRAVQPTFPATTSCSFSTPPCLNGGDSQDRWERVLRVHQVRILARTSVCALAELSGLVRAVQRLFHFNQLLKLKRRSSPVFSRYAAIIQRKANSVGAAHNNWRNKKHSTNFFVMHHLSSSCHIA